MVGIDLGGTKILAASSMRTTRSSAAPSGRPRPRKGPTAILEAIVACVDEALADARLWPNDIAAAGVGSPGPLDPETGVILFSSNLNVRDFPLGPESVESFDRPVLVQNDVRVGGYGEFRLGAGRGYRDIIAAFVGTGIGGCLIQGGQVVTGSTGNAGEIGHIIVEGRRPAVRLRTARLHGGLASKTAIQRDGSPRRSTRGCRRPAPDKSTRKAGRLKSGDLAEAVAAGDPVALKEVHRARALPRARPRQPDQRLRPRDRHHRRRRRASPR